MKSLTDPPMAEEEETQARFVSLPPEEPSAPKRIPPVLLTIFFMVPLLVVSLYFAKSMLYPQTENMSYTTRAQTPQLTSLPTTAPDTTPNVAAEDDWTTYTNTKYGYTFSYPSAYFILPQNNPELNSLSVSSYVSLPSSLDNQYKIDIIFSGAKKPEETLYEYVRHTTADSGGGSLQEVPLGQVTGYRMLSYKTIYIEKDNNVFFINTYPFSRSSTTTKILASFRFTQ